jgi:hypothetical protein
MNAYLLVLAGLALAVLVLGWLVIERQKPEN